MLVILKTFNFRFFIYLFSFFVAPMSTGAIALGMLKKRARIYFNLIIDYVNSIFRRCLGFGNQVNPYLRFGYLHL